MSILFEAASAEHQNREKAKAKELRKTQWWKQRIGPGLCHHCKNKFKSSELTMDHLTPIARGGKSTKKNCVPSCKDCNSKKGYKMDVEITLENMSAELEKLNKDESE